jgi:hypothetical protein
MVFGEAQYADVIAALAGIGLRAEFTQTGSMNAASIGTLATGYWLLITDAEDSVPWERAGLLGLICWPVPRLEASDLGPLLRS